VLKNNLEFLLLGSASYKKSVLHNRDKVFKVKLFNKVEGTQHSISRDRQIKSLVSILKYLKPQAQSI